MNTPTKVAAPRAEYGPEWDTPTAAVDPNKLFDVTAIVGSVYADDRSGLNPIEAAFVLIARQGGSGEFSFPNEDGETIVVAVSHPASRK